MRGRIESAARSGTDLVTLWREVGAALAVAVPHFQAPCFFTVDPQSLLVTSHHQEGLPEIPAEWLGREYAERDYNSMTDVLRSKDGAGTLHAATGGRPELSRKYHEEMRPNGCDQELLVALRARDGEPWGVVGLYRELGRPDFDAGDIAFVRSVAPALAEGARYALLAGQAEEPDLPEAPGLMVLDEHFAVTSSTPGTSQWLEELGGSVESLPPSVLAVAGRALRADPGPAVSRVLSVRSRWVAVHGARLDGAPARRVSVIVDAARPAHLAPLLMRAYGLTPREQEVTALLLRGATTASAALTLSISEHTVQQHLKSVFDKTGVRSRRELVSVVFHRHYEPRVRDNERRVLPARPASPARPARGGPMPSAALR